MRLAEGQIRSLLAGRAEILFEMLVDPDQAKSQRVTKAFLQMKKFDISALERAYAGQN